MRLALPWLLLMSMLLADLRAGVTSQRRPRIFLEFSTRRSPVDADSLRMSVDGRDVTAQAELSPAAISYTPTEDLAAGTHQVSVMLRDVDGARGEKSWSFVIQPDQAAPEWDLVALPPSPENGSVLNRKEAVFKFQFKGADAGELKLECFLDRKSTV